MVGYMYYIGQGTEEDYQKAVDYLSLAKSYGNPNASRYLNEAKKALKEQQSS